MPKYFVLNIFHMSTITNLGRRETLSLYVAKFDVVEIIS